MFTEIQPMFQTLPLGAVKPRGWLRAQLWQDLSTGFAGTLDSLTRHAAHDLFRHQIESSHEQFAWWDAETRGNWLWGSTMMAFLSDHMDHQTRVTSLLRDLLASQASDGYIGIYSPPWRYQHGDGENGELWAQSRALLALLAYYEFTGDAAVLQAVEAAVRLTMRHYGADRPHFRASGNPLAEIFGVTHGLCYVDVVEWLYNLTADAHYRDFGLWLYEDFCQLPVPFVNDDLSTRSLLDEHRPLSGHAVHSAEHLRVVAWAYAMTGREELSRAYDVARAKLGRYFLPSGALIGDESVHGMPLPEAGYEYCTLTELLFSLTSTLQKFGTDADHIEGLVFNAAQGARLPDGSGVAYLSQDTRLDARADRPDSYSRFHGPVGRFKFSPTHEDIACCCNPNATRLLPHYISRQWLRLTDTPGLVAMLYGACQVRTTIEGVEVEIEEITDYPFAETIEFVIRPERLLRFRLCLRQPDWAKSPSIRVNGTGVQAERLPGKLLALDRLWSAEDTVTVTFDAGVVASAYPNGEYAVRRGALQYVLAIPPAFQTIKHYPNSTLADVEVWPQDRTQAYRPCFLDAALPDYGLKVERTAGGTPTWQTAMTTLVGSDFPLVPMGSAMLRRAALPMLGAEHSPLLAPDRPDY